MPIFLKISGVTGNSTDDKHKGWFEVDGFDFGATRSVSASGQASGGVTFSPLTVDINSLVGLAPLLGDAVTGKNLGTVELVETTQSDQNVFDIKLTNASLDKFSNAGGANGIETGLTFDFQKVSLTDHGVTSEGGLGPAETTNATAQRFTAGTAAIAQTAPSENIVHYFLKVQGVTGNSTDDKHKGWFEVDGFDFGVTRPVSTTSGGGATGRATFSPLTVDINSLVGLAPLLGDAVTGKNLGTVELVETTQSDQNVFDIKLTNASLDKFSNAGGANGIETGLTFDFQKVSLTDHGVTSEGGLGPAETTNATAQRFTAGTAAIAQTAPSENIVHYFLKVQGVTGNSTDDKHKGWFEVDGFDFGVTRPVSTTSGGGATGRATFSPLTVDINSLVGLAPLLGDAITGKNLGTVELVETTQSDQNVYDIKLTNASLDKFSNTGGVHGIETGLTFDFQKVSLTDHGVTSEGGLGPAETTSATAQRFTGGTAAISAKVSSENTVHYFLKVQGVTGNSTDDKHKGWFEVDGFDFGVTRPVSTTSGGGATGRVTFSPLTVDINSLVGLAPLLGDAVTGKNLGTVELVETTQSDQNVFDIKLTNASLDKFSNAGGANGIETGLTFDFQKVSLTDHGVTSEGGLGPAETTNATAQRFTAGTAAIAQTAPSENIVHYFLKVQGVTGNSTDDKHKGWFEVDGFDFGVTRPVSTTSGGGATGRATFSPLTVDINSLVGLAPLLGDAVTGKNLGTVELVETTQADQNVYDIKLTNASLDKFSNTGGVHGIETGLTFDFQKVSLTDHGVTSEGGLGPAETTNATAQRFAAGVAVDTVSQAQNPLHYFLKVTGVTGGSTDAKHAGWFDVDKFDFGVTRPVSASGGATGRVTFSPLKADINSIVGQAPLLADLASGHDLKTVELVGVTQSDQTVYDLKLTHAMLSMVQSAAGFPGVETSLAFSFQQGTLTDHGVTTEGELSSPQTVNFNSRPSVA